MQTVLEDSLYNDEIALETRAVQRGVARYRRLAKEAIGRGDGAALKPAERLMLHWHTLYCRVIAQEKREITQGKAAKGRRIYGPYVQLLDTEKIAVIAMHEVLSACMAEPAGAKVASVALAIGRGINAELNVSVIRSNDDAWYELVHTDRKRLKPRAINRICNRFFPDSRWPIRVQAHVGGVLIYLLLKVATLDDLDKPFRRGIERYVLRRGKRTIHMLQLTPPAQEIIEEGHAVRQHLRPRYLPMIVPPLAWSDTNNGGYLRLRTTPYIRIPKFSQAQVSDQADLTTVLEGINALNGTAWRINRRILEVVGELWQSGGAVAGLPRAEKRPLPPLPAAFSADAPKGDRWKKVRPADKKAWRKEAGLVRRQNHIELSDRINFAYKAEVADNFAKYERIYFPHLLDWRGRAYAVPLYLNHQGDDVCRGLLEFADTKPLGDRGLYWLKVHIANCCGVDKVSHAQRVAWTESNAETIRGWADDPLTNTGWMEADEPWQALAAAMAYVDPEGAAQHLPIQMDGSCNGLQHYAALGRCEQTAQAVNLSPSEEPADIYEQVADRVARMVQDDAARGEALAQKLEGWINRKTVKQPTMTSVYGVTRVGARRQIQERLKEAGFSEADLYEASSYLSRITLQAVKGVCIAAGQIMEWLEDCARRIAGSRESISWTTPIGLWVEQPYRNARSIEVNTILQRLYISSRSESCPIAHRKQINGFAPNYIHSLDAAHMLCTAIACRDEALAFAAVHDSFWTHGADVDRMHEILREQFLCIHEIPLLEALCSDFRTRYPELSFDDPPAPGDLDVSLVRESPYFFS